jgi:hypothetical protein
MPELLAGRADNLVVGLLLGLAVTLVCLAGRVWHQRRHAREPTPVVGVALAAAGAAGVVLTVDQPPAPVLPVGVVLVAAGVVAALLADFDRRWRHLGLMPLLLAVSAAGVWAAVPDVEAALVVLGTTVAMTLLGWPSPLVASGPPPSLGTAGAIGVAALFVWTVAAGSAGRPAAVAGGLACLGVLVVEPVARRLGPGLPVPTGRTGRRRVGRSALGAQLVLVAVAARVVGRVERPAVAWSLTLLLLAGATAVAAVAGRRAPPADRTAA